LKTAWLKPDIVYSVSMFEEMLHGISRGDYSTVFRCFWVLRLNAEKVKTGNFRQI